MKKLFTLVAALTATVSLFAALPLNTLPSGTTEFTSEFWGSTTDKNKVIYDNGNYIMMFSQGNALTFSSAGMAVGNSSKVSAFVFRTSEAADITLNVAPNGSDITMTLYYMGETVDELTSSNLNDEGTKCGSIALTSGGEAGQLKAKNGAAGYYKVHSTKRFLVQDITLSAPTAADHTKATLTDIQVGGESLAGFTASEMTYNVELDFDATVAPTVTAETADDATVVITQATGLPGSATVVCTSYDGTSETKTYTINFTKEAVAPIIRATHTGAKTADVKGTIGGTADKNTASDGKLGSNGHYFGITLAEGTFQMGDIVEIYASALNGGNTATLFTEKEGENAIGNADFDLNTMKATYTLTADVSAIYIVRKTSDCNPHVRMIQVIRPVDDGQPALNVDKNEIALNVTAESQTVSAVVTFSGKHLTPGSYVLTVPNVAGLSADPTSVTVGEDGKLNAQVTITYTSTVDVAAASANISLTIDGLSESVAVNYSAVQAKQYITSVNIEQLVMVHGTKYDIRGAFDAANIAYANINALDTLNNSKGAARNEAYLGLKFKTEGAYIAGWVQNGQTIRVKFGYAENDVLAIAGNDTMTLTPANKTLNVLEYTATADTYVKIQTTSGKTVVIKQIMVDEAVADVMYKITYAAAENGEVSGWTVAFPGESVELSFAPAEGYMVMHCYVNETEIHQSAPGEPITFEMPAEDVTITTEFSLPTAIDNTNVAVKATKRVINGVLFIEKNGVLYDAQGAIVK